MDEEAFRKVVDNIFNNWTALRLAVDNGMGGPNSKQTAFECMEYMVHYCLYEPGVQVSDIQEALEDILDEEFDTVCEDDSPKEIAHILFRFLSLLKDNNMAQFEADYNNLPTSKVWLPVKESQGCSNSQTMESMDDDSPSEDQPQTATTQESEWTEVKSRRRR